MPEIYQKLENRIKEKLSAVEHISLTTDIWTGARKTDSFFSLIAHCFSPQQRQRTTFVLGAKYLSMNHSEFNIAEVLSSLLEEWNISSDKVHVIVTEVAANTTVDPNLTKVERVGCFIRSLDLVVHHAILEQKSVIEIREKCRRIIHSSHSALASNKLKKIHKNLKIPYQKFIPDLPNKWESSLRMVLRIHERKEAVVAYAIEYDIPALTAAQWTTIESIIRVLKPFEEIIKQASSDNETIAYVIPAVATLYSYLTKRERDSRIHAMKLELQKALNKRFYSSEGFKVLIKYLSPPPCLVNLRRLNAAATIYIENRNELSPENAEKLIFVMRNMKIVNFVY